MAKATFSLSISDNGALDAFLAEIAAMPKAVEKARRRTLVKLKTWLERQVLRVVAQEVGMAQKGFRALGRFWVDQNRETFGITLWIGTNPIAVHKLGTVRWTPGMKGARVGKRLFPGTWSWGEGSRTGTAVMERTGEVRTMSKGRYEGKEREAIQVVKVDIDERVKARVAALMPMVSDRFERILLQELRYALKIEQRAA